MPSENVLAKEYDVSRLTIRRALDTLSADGLITRRQGRGTFATSTSQLGRQSADIGGLLENLVAMGLQTDVKLISCSVEKAPFDIASLMEIPADSIVQKAIRVRSYRGRPFSHLTTYLPEDISKQVSAELLASTPLMKIFQDLGVQVSHADQALSAVLADIDTAPLLDVAIGSPLLSIRRVVRDTSNRVVEYLDAVYCPDRYEYRMELSRVNQSGNQVWQTKAHTSS